jgi:hypothetical protein
MDTCHKLPMGAELESNPGAWQKPVNLLKRLGNISKCDNFNVIALRFPRKAPGSLKESLLRFQRYYLYVMQKPHLVLFFLLPYTKNMYYSEHTFTCFEVIPSLFVILPNSTPSFKEKKKNSRIHFLRGEIFLRISQLLFFITCSYLSKYVHMCLQ